MTSIKRKIITIFMILALFVTSAVTISLAWLASQSNTMGVSVKGKIVSDYFHCGNGTEDDPFIITRPIHYYHMVEFFQRTTNLPVVIDNTRTEVKFGEKYLYFQIGCPENQLYDKTATPSGTDYYVYEYDNEGQSVKTNDVENKSQTLNMAYYSGSNSVMPIGTSSKPFFGAFDGKGITIKNLNVVTSSTVSSTTRSTSDVGIFGTMLTTGENESTIKNAYFDDVTINLTGSKASEACNISSSTIHDTDGNGTSDTVYIGYLVGHLYAYDNATIDYNIGSISSDASPICNVYFNNVSIAGGTSSNAVCNYGYFGCIDTLDGEGAKTVADLVDDIAQTGTGDEGWGGSIDMESLYDRLYAQIGSSGTRVSTYPTNESVLVPADIKTSAKVAVNSTANTSRNDNRDTIYYWSATNLVSAGTYANTTGGTVVGSRSNSWIYLYGLKDMGLTTTTVYSKTGPVETAYYISDNAEYLTIDTTGPSITQKQLSKEASKFIFDQASGSSTIKCYGENVTYYINANSTNDGITVSTSSSGATVWNFLTDAKGNVYIYYKATQADSYYLYYEDGWKLVKSITYDYIHDGNSHYLSANVSGVFNVSSSSDSVSWHIDATEAATKGTKAYFTSGTTNYYLSLVDGKLGVSTSVCYWKTETSGDKTFYYTVSGGLNYYITYDNGWKAEPKSGFRISNGNNYIAATASSVTNSNSSGATLFQRIVNASDANKMSFYIVSNGTKYYLTNTGTNLSMTVEDGAEVITWTKDAYGYYRTIDSVNYYLVYQNGWKLALLTGTKLYYGSYYLSWEETTVGGETKYVLTSTTEANACLWQRALNNIMTLIGDDKYYVVVDENGNLALEKEKGNIIWPEDEYGIYNYINNVDKVYLVYDKGFKVSVRTGYKISDGAGNYLTKVSTTVGVSNEANATIWQLTNASIASDSYTGNNSYIYTIDGTKRYYLTDVSGSLGFVEPNRPNLIDYSIESKTMTNRQNNMEILYNKDSKSFTLHILTDKDPHATIDQTVHLEAGTTYYMYLDCSNYTSNSSIQIFYAINGAYSEGQSHKFWHEDDRSYTFTVPTTGDYTIRMDNDYHRDVTISNFYIGTEPYDGPWSSFEQWKRDTHGYYLEADSEKIYLNYNTSATKWELVTLGGINVYTTIGSNTYYLNATGSIVTALTDMNSASIWHMDTQNRIYTLVGTTKYYLSYEERISTYTSDTGTGVLRSTKDAVIILTTDSSKAISWKEDSSGLYIVVSLPSNFTLKSVNFYLIYDAIDSNWKLRANGSTGFMVSDDLGDEGIKYLSINENETDGVYASTELDSDYATIWFADGVGDFKKVFAFSGLSPYYLVPDFNGVHEYGLTVSQTCDTTKRNGNVVFDGTWRTKVGSDDFRTKIDNISINAYWTKDGWVMAHGYHKDISCNGNYLVTSGTDIVNSTTKESIWITYYVTSTTSGTSHVDESFDNISSSQGQLIIVLIGGYHYLLVSDANGNLSLKDGVRIFEEKMNTFTPYYWYKDSIGLYTMVDGLKRYLTYTGSKWITTTSAMLITEYNTSNYLSVGITSSGDYETVNLSGVLPVRYEQVDYIESNGTQYINVGITSSDSNVIEATVYYTVPTILYGSDYNGWATNSAILSNSYNFIYFCTSTSSFGYSGTGMTVIRQAVDKITINGTDYTYSNDPSNFTGKITFFRGWARIPGTSSASMEYGSYRLYSAKIYTDNGNTLARNLIPVYDNVSGGYGLYDLVTKQFFGNSGTGSFTCDTHGAPTSYGVTDRYQFIEYIEGTGTQYIDVDVKTSDSNVIEAKVSYDTPTALYGSTANGYSTNSAIIYRNTGAILFLKANGCYSYAGTGLTEIRQTSSNVTINGTSNTYGNDSNGRTGSITFFRGWGQISADVYPAFQYGVYKLYSAKIYTDNGSTLVRDLKPCYDNKTGECGLYDLVTEQFFGNSGTGTFNHPSVTTTYNSMRITGVNIPSGYTQLNSIICNGNQYINTGLTGVNQDYAIEGYFSFSKTNNNSLWCSRNNSSKNTFTLFCLNQFRTDYNTTSNKSVGSNVTTGTIYKVAQIGRYFLINDQLAYTHSEATFSSNNALTLFRSYNTTPSSMNDTYSFNGEFYGLRVFDGSGNLVRCYVPCKQDSTGYIGVYETVTGTFSRSASGTDFTFNGVSSIVNETNKSSAKVWYFESGKLLTKDTNNVSTYLNGTKEGELSLSDTSSTTWTSASTTNGASYQTSFTMLDGKSTTYALYRSGSDWLLKPTKYTYVKTGSSYLSFNGTTISSTTLINDSSKLYLTNSSIGNTGSGTTALFTIVDGTIYYLTYNSNTFALEFSTTNYTSWNRKNGLYYTTIGSVEFAITMINSTWMLDAKNYFTFKSNGVDLGVSTTELTTTQTRFYTDSSNRVFALINGSKYYIHFNSGFSVSTSETNAMKYNSSTKQIYLNGVNLYYDTNTSYWNVFADGSFKITDGTNYLRVTSTSTFENITDSSKASYFVLTDNTNHTGNLYTYYNCEIVYINYNSSTSNNSYLRASTTASTTWENIEGANSSAGVRDLLVYYASSSTYYLSFSTNWTTSTLSSYTYKIANVSNGSGNSFLKFSGTSGLASSNLSKTTKANASTWTFSSGYGGKNPSGYFYTGDYCYFGHGSDIFYVSNATTGIFSRYKYKNSWENNNNVLSYESDSETYYINFDSSDYRSSSGGTTLYFYPVSNSVVSHTNPSLTPTTVDNSSAFSSTSSDISNNATELTLENVGDYSSTKFGTKVEYGICAARIAIVNFYYSIEQTIPNSIVPNAVITAYANASNILKKIINASTSTGVNIIAFSASLADIHISSANESPSVRLIQTTDQSYVSTSVQYQRGCYVACRTEKQDNGSDYSDYHAAVKNTGYIVGGDYSAASGSGQGDIRVSGYSSGNIDNSYSSGNFTTLYTFNDNGLQAINDSANSYTEYVRTKADFKTILQNSGSTVYGLHFMDTAISTNHIINAESVLINGKNYANYELPESCIDFNVYRAGTITLYAGDYYSGNSCFFSLNQVFRDSNNHITSIVEISEIYKKNNDARATYIYKYADGSYSANISATDLANNYSCVFKMKWLTNPNNGNSFSHDYIYYFEIPCNKGEYALGSVSGRDGGYLLYLDVATNGAQGDSYNDEFGIGGAPLFTQIDYRSSGTVYNSLLNVGYTIPSGNTQDNFKVTVNFDGTYTYTIFITNNTGKEFSMSVLLIDDDDNPENTYNYNYKIIYNGEVWTLGEGFNSELQVYQSSLIHEFS